MEGTANLWLVVGFALVAIVFVIILLSLYSRQKSVEKAAALVVTKTSETLQMAGFPFSADRMVGNYKIQEKISDGGATILFRVVDTQGYPFVLKVPRPEYLKDQPFLERFFREGDTLKQLDDPHIIRFVDKGKEMWQATEVPYLILEHVDGRDLSDLIAKEAPFAPLRAAKIVLSIADALKHSHEKGVIHRNIKPHNVLISALKDEVKVTNFGIARSVDTKGMTQVGGILGTPQYMAPEQIEDKETGPYTDIYALGVVFYEMLIGSTPFQEKNPYLLISKILKDPPLPPSQVNSKVQASLDEVVMKMLAKNPQERYPSAKSLSDALSILLTRMGEARSPIV
ncbi:MAG: serine/threonine protein kinase [Armatimonadetes bacterium]|nr:serine/threonine protein kinase [Armatimonadota bacterium]